MARGFGRRQRRELSILTQLTLRGLGSLLYMTRGKPSCALIQLILQLWLTQLSHLLRELQPTTTLDRLGSASRWPHQLPSPELCPDCGALTPVARGCYSRWHLDRPPGKFSSVTMHGTEESAKRHFDDLNSIWVREILDPELLVSTRTYDEIMNYTNKHLGDAITRYISSTPDVPSESFYDQWFKQGQWIKGKYRWQYDD